MKDDTAEGQDATREQLAELAAVAGKMAEITERGQQLWGQFLAKTANDPKALMPNDPLNAGPTMARLVAEMWNRPKEMAEAGLTLWMQQAELWNRMARKMMGEEVEPMIQPDRGDKRFKDEEWSQNQVFDYIKQSYLLTSKWIADTVHDIEAESAELDPFERRKIELCLRNFIEAMSPTNFFSTNPAVLRATVDEKGENLVRGLENMLRDLERGKGSLLISQTDMEAFAVGRNMAMTPGKVVYENNLMQLIQYTPTTEDVYKTPLLIVPPWINKFYILDLNEKKSMIRWLVGQGHTVFVISWVNPDEKQKDETWESYMKSGVLEALGKVLEETGEEQAHMVGYCIGGTMLGSTLAWMAATGDDRAASATFFTTQLEFSNAGELQVFVDDETLKSLGEQIREKGYLDAENMATAFNMLRASDLIWGYVINNYMLGKDPFPFDLLYWNSDSTCMPGQVHLYYLDTFYRENLMARGEMVLGGEKLDLSKIKLPVYHIATIEDHIAPAESAFRGAKLLGSRSAKFVLSGSGHIAGVVNPPAMGKYQYWTKKGLAGKTLDEWREGTEETAGSWWPDWDQWLASKSKSKVPAREPGKVLGAIEDAPGRYVKVRFDER